MDNAWNTGFRSFLAYWDRFRSKASPEAMREGFGGDKAPDIVKHKCVNYLKGITPPSKGVGGSHNNILDLIVRTDAVSRKGGVQLKFWEDFNYDRVRSKR